MIQRNITHITINIFLMSMPNIKDQINKDIKAKLKS